ncbi:thioesterase domain-containing protein [Saccharothrix sp. BKS2]|uniref:thioesterase II family protein n=1 Tax=Saccharothrix sp. BKS2 TaxID=3064400 RepID=UPI0039EB7C25
MIPSAPERRKSLLDQRFRSATARHGLYCFPAAGGAAPRYAGWSDHFRGPVELVPVRPPGPPGTIRPAPAEVDGLADELAAEISSAHTRPMLLGHRAGAVLALEVARRLEELGRPATHLFVSGRAAPPPARTARSLSLLPRLPAGPVTTRTRHHRPAPPLSCPVFAWCGSSDPEVGPSALQGWAAETTAGLKLFVRPGGRSFLAHHVDEVVRVVHEAAARFDGAARPAAVT